MKRWGPPRRPRLCSQSTNLWATVVFVPRSSVLATPNGASYVGNLPTCGPLLTLSPALTSERWPPKSSSSSLSRCPRFAATASCPLHEMRSNVLTSYETMRLTGWPNWPPPYPCHSSPLFTLTSPSSISVGGTETPSPAKKWIAALRLYPTHPGVHWVTWLPLGARRRQVWLQWLWCNIRWQGCPPPWEKINANYELCHDTHRGTPHARLVHCAAWRPIYLQEWVRTWGPWADLAQQWLTTASPDDMNPISKLCILQSQVDSAPPPPPRNGI